MLQVAGNGNKIELTDSAIETATIIHLFLDFLTKGTVNITHKADNISAHIQLVMLLNKFDCKAALSTLRLAVRGLIKHSGSVLTTPAFIIAAHLDDYETAAQAIEVAGHWKYPIGGGDKLSDCVPGSGILDLAGIDFEEYAQYPPRYAHALLRASKKRSLGLSPGEEWNQVADEFKRLMAESGCESVPVMLKRS